MFAVSSLLYAVSAGEQVLEAPPETPFKALQVNMPASIPASDFTTPKELLCLLPFH